MLLKKNILEKNRNNHPELSADDNRNIFDAALYHAEEIINDKPSAKPNYWVLAKIDGKSSIVTIEISETKDANEIVGWRFASAKSVEQIKNRAGREGGQVLVTKSDAQGSSDLHDLSSGNNDNIEDIPENSSPRAEKSSSKDAAYFRRLYSEILNLNRQAKETPAKIGELKEQQPVRAVKSSICGINPNLHQTKQERATTII